jgi:hypothetical protein
MYDMDKCVDYVEIPDMQTTDKFWWDTVAAIRLDGRIWLLQYEPHGRYFDWLEYESGWDGWVETDNLIDRHYLEQAHGELFGSTALQNGAL